MFEALGSNRYRATLSRPLIYLDHWAIRHFASARADRERFLHSFQEHGHLALSVANLFEIAMHEDGTSVDSMESFLSETAERLWLVAPHPDRVAESMRSRGQTEDLASFDRDTAEHCAAWKNAAPGPLCAADFLRWIREDPSQVRTPLHATRTDIRATFEAARVFAGRPARLMPPAAGTPSQVCFEALVRSAIVAPEPFEENDAMDLFHAAVPLAICDFVLLDNRWKLRAEAIPRPPRRAMVFSGKKGQIEAFLDALDRASTEPLGDST